MRRRVLSVSGLWLGAGAFGFALIPLVGVFPAAVCLCLGFLLSLSAFLLGRLRDKVWDGLAMGAMLLNVCSAGVAAGVNFLFLWGLDLVMAGVVRLLEELVEPLRNYPSF